MAESVFIKEAKDKRVYSDWPRVDSAGTTDWNEGSLPDYRAAAVLEREGLEVRLGPRTGKKDYSQTTDPLPYYLQCLQLQLTYSK